MGQRLSIGSICRNRVISTNVVHRPFMSVFWGTPWAVDVLYRDNSWYPIYMSPRVFLIGQDDETGMRAYADSLEEAQDMVRSVEGECKRCRGDGSLCPPHEDD